MRNWIWWVGGGLVLLCAVVLLLSWRASHRTAGTAATPIAIAPAAPPAAISNPVPQSADLGPLPALDQSDQPLHDALADLVGVKALDALIRPNMLLRHIVVTIDNLPRKRIATELRPIKTVPGQFTVSGEDQTQQTIAAANYERYAPYVHVIEHLDVAHSTALYFHFYPLFQEAYQNLGYPNGYFNDRLVAAIDDMLSTPEPAEPVALVHPNVMYQFADPNLEALSAGQKLLLRMGPANAAIVKAKLRELRTAVAAHGNAQSH
jgi:Protein of unknown function (DUF3014)